MSVIIWPECLFAECYALVEGFVKPMQIVTEYFTQEMSIYYDRWLDLISICHYHHLNKQWFKLAYYSVAFVHGTLEYPSMYKPKLSLCFLFN